jgi:hypothetical protein
MLSQTIANLEDGLNLLRRDVLILAEAMLRLTEQVDEIRREIAVLKGASQ